MAGFGAKYPCFAPFEGAEPSNALPAYGNMVVIGGLVAANLTVNLASGELYSDDRLTEQVSEFANGSIAMETDDMEDAVAAVVYDATVTGGDVIYNAGDTPPYGGLGYYKVLMRDGVKLFKSYYYPKVKATIGADNAQTKGSGITFQTANTTFTVFAPNTGDWRYTAEHETETEAIAWVQEKLGVTP